jgi:hypothetical protein
MNRAIARLLAFCAVLATTATANALVNPFISNCTTITQPGSYFLTTNITATNLPANAACITIQADFVTLDLLGHTITGQGSSSSNNGISVGFVLSLGQPLYTYQNGIEVRAGVVTGFAKGVNLLGSAHTVEHVRAIGNNVGIVVGDGNPFQAQRHRIMGNTAVNNLSVGIQMGCPSLVTENVASGNGTNIVPDGGACTIIGNAAP